MSWDYGLADQIAREYETAMRAGKCYRCLSNKAERKGEICFECQEEIEEKTKFFQQFEYKGETNER